MRRVWNGLVLLRRRVNGFIFQDLPVKWNLISNFESQHQNQTVYKSYSTNWAAILVFGARSLPEKGPFILNKVRKSYIVEQDRAVEQTVLKLFLFFCGAMQRLKIICFRTRSCYSECLYQPFGSTCNHYSTDDLNLLDMYAFNDKLLVYTILKNEKKGM